MAEVRDTKSAALRVPDPQFPTKIPAGRRSSTPAELLAASPDPDPQTGISSVGPLRWARCPEQGAHTCSDPPTPSPPPTRATPAQSVGGPIPAEASSSPAALGSTVHGLRHGRDLPDARPQPERRQTVNTPGSDSPLIDSPATAAEALRDYFLANAEAGDNAANAELVAELVRRIRTQQASGGGSR